LSGAIEALQQAAEAERAACEAYLAALPGPLQEECTQKWDREAARKSPAELYQNYLSSNEGANTRITKRWPALVELRTGFVYSFHFSGDPAAEDNRSIPAAAAAPGGEPPAGLRGPGARSPRAGRAELPGELCRPAGGIHQAGPGGDQGAEPRPEGYALRDRRLPLQPYSKKDTRRYYEMIMDTGVYQGSIFRETFFQKHGETITDLFNEITRDRDDFPENVQTLTDYRSYLDFDIIITDTHNHKSYFSKVARDKSGGETQVPFYVAILASFYQAYQLYRKSDTLRLVVFDEAFNRMDADRIEEAVAFMKNLGFQAVVVAPTGRIQLIVPHMNTNLIVMRDGFNSFIERVSRKDLDRWS
jgi:hypothetical protein